MNIKIFSLNLSIAWIFIAIFGFCIYVLFGLYVTEGLETLPQILLSWVIYTLLWITFLNVFILGYFWSVVKKKTGPYGLRGPEGETGTIGSKGQCGITASQAYCMQQLNQYINDLYQKNNTANTTNILDAEIQKFPCRYLNEKIQKIAGSRQFQVIVGNLSTENKSIDNIVNYLKSIWQEWFNLIYNGTEVKGAWFIDEYGDENYSWVGVNPFIEIKKYDVYYWGITRDFRPLKAEICRASIGNPNSKFPKPQYLQEPRLKIIETNNYSFIANDKNTRAYFDASWWRPRYQEIDGEMYYPVGDIVVQEHYPVKWGDIVVGDYKIPKFSPYWNGPDMKTILVAGDVKDPIGYDALVRPNRGDYKMGPYNVKCPEGYVDMGNIEITSYIQNSPNTDKIKCVPKDCVEPLKSGGSGLWEIWRFWHFVINNYRSGFHGATGDNGYNLFRTSDSRRPFYRIKQSCLEKPPPPPPQEVKDVEQEYDDLGIGWYGHPYKLDPKYSIFTFLNLVPEGMIVNDATGHRFYIVHYGGEEINIYNILTYYKKTNKYNGSLQVTSVVGTNESFADVGDGPDPRKLISETTYKKARIRVVKLVKKDSRQQWKIIFDSKQKKLFKLKNISNNAYLYIHQEKTEGLADFTTVDINNYKNDNAFAGLDDYELNTRTDFSFISTFGPQLDIVDKAEK